MYLFAFLLILHIIGDFYLQWNKLAKSKEAIFNAVASGRRGLVKARRAGGCFYVIYLIPFLALIMLNSSELKLIAMLIIAISHFFIDDCILLKRLSSEPMLSCLISMHIAVLLIVLMSGEFHIPHWLVATSCPSLFWRSLSSLPR